MENALVTSLLLLPNEFTEKELYYKICGLSYTGDIRAIGSLGENPNKIKNIVDSNFYYFRKLYYPIIKTMSHLTAQNTQNQQQYNNNMLKDSDKMYIFQQNPSLQSTANLLHRLPQTIRHYEKVAILLEQYGKFRSDYIASIDEIDRGIIDDNNNNNNNGNKDFSNYNVLKTSSFVKDNIAAGLYEALHTTVRKSSRTQTLKGILTSGIYKSIIYGWKKFGKAILRR